VSFLSREKPSDHLREYAPGRFTRINPGLAPKEKQQRIREQKAAKDLQEATKGFNVTQPLSRKQIADMEKRAEDALREPLKELDSLTATKAKLTNKQADLRAAMVKKYGDPPRRVPLRRHERAVDPFVNAFRRAKVAGAKEVGSFERVGTEIKELDSKLEESASKVEALQRQLLHDPDVRLVVKIVGEVARQHIHEDGSLGGLVGESVKVPTSAYVGLDSVVRDGCVIGKDAMVTRSEISGPFYIEEDVEVNNSILTASIVPQASEQVYTVIDENLDSEIVRRL
jgi:hypothetical protein